MQTEHVTVGSAVSLFSGAGGLDLGIESAGFSILAAVEWDEDACDTMEKNAPTYFPGLREVVRADLYPLVTGVGEGLTTRDILRAVGLSSRERPDLLVGGPPCVAFSKSGFWLDWKHDGVDPAASLLQAYTRVLAEARPRYQLHPQAVPHLLVPNTRRRTPPSGHRGRRRSSGVVLLAIQRIDIQRIDIQRIDQTWADSLDELF